MHFIINQKPRLCGVHLHVRAKWSLVHLTFSIGLILILSLNRD